MKLTKNDIKQKRAELVEVLLKIEKLKADKTSLEKTLSADFEQNEAAYRNGGCAILNVGSTFRLATDWQMACDWRQIARSSQVIQRSGLQVDSKRTCV